MYGGLPHANTQGTCSNNNRLCLVHWYGRHFVLCRCVRKHTHRGYTADPAPDGWQEANPIWSWAGDLQIPSNTSCRGINSLSLITKSTSPDSSTYHLTTKSTWSPQLDAVNSSLWVWRSSCYCLGSHSDILWRNALPSWSKPSTIFSPIQGWVSHSLDWSLDPGSCSQVLPISLSPSFFTSVPISQHFQGWNLCDDSTLSIWTSTLPITQLVSFRTR